jgi:hypothetical protein
VAVGVAGIEALQVDVMAAPGASVCEVSFGAPEVLTENDHSWWGLDLKRGHRTRLYLLDLPEGSSTRILAIAIVAPEACFERVMEAATPIVDSVELHRGDGEGSAFARRTRITRASTGSGPENVLNVQDKGEI